MQRIKQLLKASRLFFAVSITLGIAFLSLISISEMPVSFGNSDKVYHFIAYFSLSFSWLLACYKKEKRTGIFIVIGCIIFGTLIEVLQATMTSYRAGEYLDILANTVGIVVALIVFNILLKKITLNKQ